jgi:hypothetical protein
MKIDHAPVGERIPHRGCYPCPPHRKVVKVEVEIMLDSVTGWGDCIEDHLNLILINNLYVQAVTVLPEPSDTMIKADLASAEIY